MIYHTLYEDQNPYLNAGCLDLTIRNILLKLDPNQTANGH